MCPLVTIETCSPNVPRSRTHCLVAVTFRIRISCAGILAESPRALRPVARSLADVHDIPGGPTWLAARPAAFPTGSPHAVQSAPGPVCGMRLWRVRGKPAFATSSRSVGGDSVRLSTTPLAYYCVGRRLGGRSETRCRSLRSRRSPRRPGKRGPSSSFVLQLIQVSTIFI